MKNVQCLVMAKAPEPGQVKTRLAADLGDELAADLAAAALLDTLDAAREAFGVGRCRLALAGDLDRAQRGSEIREALAGWQVFAQHGDDFGARLAHAHGEVADAPVVQVGMDTPQATPAQLIAVAAALDDHDAVVGLADDGGWWVLGLRDPRDAVVLGSIPTSEPTTGELTVAALRERGLDVGLAESLCDVDTLADGDVAAAAAPGSRFARTWHERERAIS